MLAAGSKGATQSEILNKERFLTVSSREKPTQTPTHKSEFLVYLYQVTGVETLES